MCVVTWVGWDIGEVNMKKAPEHKHTCVGSGTDGLKHEEHKSLPILRMKNLDEMTDGPSGLQACLDHTGGL